MDCGSRCKYFGATAATQEERDAIRQHCLDCKVCDDSNSIKVFGHPVVFMGASTDLADWLLQNSVPERYKRMKDAPTGGVTALPLEIEDKFRQVLAFLFGLKPIELLLVWHFANGGTLSDFHDRCEALVEKINSYKTKLDKRMCFEILKRLRNAFPAVDVLFDRSRRKNTHTIGVD